MKFDYIVMKNSFGELPIWQNALGLTDISMKITNPLNIAEYLVLDTIEIDDFQTEITSVPQVDGDDYVSSRALPRTIHLRIICDRERNPQYRYYLSQFSVVGTKTDLIFYKDRYPHIYAGTGSYIESDTLTAHCYLTTCSYSQSYEENNKVIDVFDVTFTMCDPYFRSSVKFENSKIIESISHAGVYEIGTYSNAVAEFMNYGSAKRTSYSIVMNTSDFDRVIEHNGRHVYFVEPVYCCFFSKNMACYGGRSSEGEPAGPEESDYLDLTQSDYDYIQQGPNTITVTSQFPACGSLMFEIGYSDLVFE